VHFELVLLCVLLSGVGFALYFGGDKIKAFNLPGAAYSSKTISQKTTPTMLMNAIWTANTTVSNQSNGHRFISLSNLPRLPAKKD
jgi:hypothetical protein